MPVASIPGHISEPGAAFSERNYRFVANLRLLTRSWFGICPIGMARHPLPCAHWRRTERRARVCVRTLASPQQFLRAFPRVPIWRRHSQDALVALARRSCAAQVPLARRSRPLRAPLICVVLVLAWLARGSHAAHLPLGAARSSLALCSCAAEVGHTILANLPPFRRLRSNLRSVRTRPNVPLSWVNLVQCRSSSATCLPRSLGHMRQ